MKSELLVATPPSTANPYANPEPRFPGCPPEFVPLADIIQAELARTPKAPKPNDKGFTPSRCLQEAGRVLAASFIAWIPDKPEPVLALSILDRVCVYTFDTAGTGTRLVINITHVRADPTNVRWITAKTRTWGHETGQFSG